jgi:transketolase
MRITFVETLLKLASKDNTIFLLTADLGFKLFDDFRKRFPDRFINIGVAEQNMIGVAAGLSLSGKNVYCYSMVPFLAIRALEFIRVNLCYQNLSVKLIGVGGGLTYGLEGMTHHAIEDLALMRSLPNMTVVAPGDPVEARAVIMESLEYPGPLYIRLGGNNDPIVHQDSLRISIGRGTLVNEGDALTIFSTGTMLAPANEAVNILAKSNISATLISLHTVKPLDTDLIVEHTRKSLFIFTIEEHSLIGGLGTAVGEVLLENGYRGFFQKIGLPDRYGESIGRAQHLRQFHGLTSEVISAEIRNTIIQQGIGIDEKTYSSRRRF